MPPSHSNPSRLPDPDPIAAAHGERVAAHLHAAIAAAGGWLPFDRFMDLALHAPGLGYYAAGAAKFGPDGDFVTAPELSPLFARVLATQVVELFDAIGPGPGRILEFGAGTGALGAELLAELGRRGVPVAAYQIVETSPDLRERQRTALAGGSRDGSRAAHESRGPLAVEWLDRPPERHVGVVLANEVLDVMPVKLFVKNAATEPDAVHERGVVATPHGFAFEQRPAPPDLAGSVARIEAECGAFEPGYGSEVGLVARAWVAGIGQWLARGAALLIDYGFPAREYYHPQRLMGTLMCHFRHRAHADPLWWPGLNDITAHVDFSAAAASAHAAGLDVLGYTSQAHFLINCGLVEMIGRAGADGSAPADRAALRLVSESEMGELFKVLAVGRGLAPALRGFSRGDRTDRL